MRRLTRTDGLPAGSGCEVISAYTELTTDDASFENLCDLIRLAVPPPTVSVDRRAALATHEAGHAVVDHVNGLQVTRVAILTDDEGRAHSSASGDAVLALLEDATPTIVAPFIQGAVAGIVAEAMVTEHPRWDHSYADMALAKEFADLACASDEKVHTLLGRCIEEAKLTLRERWPSVLEIAEWVEERGEIGGDELRTMLARARVGGTDAG